MRDNCCWDGDKLRREFIEQIDLFVVDGASLGYAVARQFIIIAEVYSQCHLSQV